MDKERWNPGIVHQLDNKERISDAHVYPRREACDEGTWSDFCPDTRGPPGRGAESSD